MKREKRIYCIEGVWDYGRESVEPSVEPMLELLRRQGLWNYVRRNCATLPELKYFLSTEWSTCAPGSILYITTHGERAKIYLSDESEVVGLDTLAPILERKCKDRLVHFGGCEVLSGNTKDVAQRARTFVARTSAMGISGYGVDTGWTDNWAPAVALELMLFSSISSLPVDLTNGKHFQRLGDLVADLKKRFKDCSFEMYTRLDLR